MENATITLIRDMASKTQAIADAMAAMADHLEKEKVTISVAELAQSLPTLHLS